MSAGQLKQVIVRIRRISKHGNGMIMCVSVGAAVPLPAEQHPANLVAQLSGDVSELEGFIRNIEDEIRC